MKIDSQLQRIDQSTVNNAQDFALLPRIEADNKQWVLEEWIHKANTRKRTSWVHSYGFVLIEMRENTPTSNILWFCKICDSHDKYKPYILTSTTPLADHLTKHHDKKPPNDDDASSSSSSVPSSLTSSVNTIVDVFGRVAKRARETTISVTIGAFETFKQKVIKWIVVENVALSAVESDLFRDLFISTTIQSFLPKSGDTIRRWIIEDLNEKKKLVKKHIHDHSQGQIHLSFDLWTSPNHKSLLGVVFHYMDDSYTIQTRLVALKRLPGRHGGVNLGQALIQIINDYDIADRIGCFVTDNADTNDKATEYVLRLLRPDLPSEAHIYRRIRCWGHVMNLAAKAFLFGKDPRVFEVESELNSTARSRGRRIGCLEEKGSYWEATQL